MERKNWDAAIAQANRVIRIWGPQARRTNDQLKTYAPAKDAKKYARAHTMASVNLGYGSHWPVSFLTKLTPGTGLGGRKGPAEAEVASKLGSFCQTGVSSIAQGT